MPKTLDEVKNWMGKCANLKCSTPGDKCPWDCGSAKCIGDLLLDGLSRIQRLETENHQLFTKVKQLQAERDAAIADMKEMAQYVTDDVCDWCDQKGCKGCAGVPSVPHFKWRGVQKEG